MKEDNQTAVKSIINSLNKRLRDLVEDLVIKDDNVYLTLKTTDGDDSKSMEFHKNEFEAFLKKKQIFKEIFITFVKKEKLFKKVIAISSCKGGVGKSTIATYLALSLRRQNYSVGLLDADIYGPSIPKLLNISEKPRVDEKKKIIPVVKNGIKVMSIGLLIEEEKPVIWRGPMIQSALTQLIDEVKWEKLDYLVIDLPPGTGDAYLAILQKLKIDKSLVVTTSQDLAISDTKKGINLMMKFGIPLTGLIENMSYFSCSHCSAKHYIFGEKKVEELAKKFNTKVISKFPILGAFNEETYKLFDELAKEISS